MLLDNLLYTFFPLAPKFDCGPAKNLTYNHQRPRGYGRAGIRHAGGVRMVVEVFFQRQVQLVGNNFRYCRQQTLADLAI